MLRFSPTAMAKLLHFRDRGPTEIAGFAVTSVDDPLYVEEFATVRQNAGVAGVIFDDEAVADYFDRQVDLGRRPEQFARVWIHTHPGSSPQPSGTDEECFSRVFGNCDWSVMFILARTGESYCRLRFGVGPGAEMTIPVEVDCSGDFAGSDRAAWDQEYEANVQCRHWPAAFGVVEFDDGFEDVCFGETWLEDLERMDPAEREVVLAELRQRPDLWDVEYSHV